MFYVVGLFFLGLFLCNAQTTAPPVTVLLAYESCCPYCQAFITGTFKTAWETNGFSSITNITFIPYGNAEETYNAKTGQYNFTCQHGVNECRGNLVEACWIGLNNYDPLKYLDFIVAYEEKLSSQDCAVNAYTVAEEMLPSYGMSWDTMHACVDSDVGNAYQHDMALATPSDHTYVPWIVVNGNHNEAEQNECQDDLLLCVCQRYTGTSPACDNYVNKKNKTFKNKN